MVQTRLIACSALLLLAACGIPYKFEVFQLHPGDRDVVWVFRDGALYRCATYTGQPFCVRTVYAENAPMEASPTAPMPSTSAPTPSAKDLR